MSEPTVGLAALTVSLHLDHDRLQSLPSRQLSLRSE